VEGYQIHRLTKEIKGSLGFEVKGKEVNWGWLRARTGQYKVRETSAGLTLCEES